MSSNILPCPDHGHLSTPTPDDVATAMVSLRAVEAWPGVWTAVLSTGETLRVTVIPACREAVSRAVRDAR